MSDGEQSTSGEPHDPNAVTFVGFVLSLAHTAAYHFGDVPDPVTGQSGTANLAAAQQIIDILLLIELKTRGNLTADGFARAPSYHHPLMVRHAHHHPEALEG